MTGPDSPSAAQAGEGLSRELGRVAGRLRAMPLPAVPVGLVLATAQALADLAAGATGEPARVVPEVAPYAAADQIAVLAAEVERACGGLDAVDAEALSDAARDLLAELRAAL